MIYHVNLPLEIKKKTIHLKIEKRINKYTLVPPVTLLPHCTLYKICKI